MTPAEFAKPFRVSDGRKFRLKDHDPAGTLHIKAKQRAQQLLAKGITQLSELQEKLYANGHWALLLIFQAMDAAGKDGAIKHVMSGVNPQGCEVYSFKAPSEAELSHDFMWRTSRCLPERGRIGIFNRSYYEEVLVVRVRKELLARQRLAKELVTKDIWNERFEDINAFERYLTRNGVVIRKFFLNISKQEQRKRFLSRLEEPSKRRKFEMGDVRDREYWDDYMEAYEEMIRHTASPHAPWYVVPADKKWFTRVVVAAAIIDAVEGLELEFPKLSAAKLKEQKAARVALLGDGALRVE